jgi:hypothetical protein
VVGVGAAAAVTFPFSGQLLGSKIGILIGSLALTRLGEIIPAVIRLLKSEDWTDSAIADRIKTLAQMLVKAEDNEHQR